MVLRKDQNSVSCMHHPLGVPEGKNVCICIRTIDPVTKKPLPADPQDVQRIQATRQARAAKANGTPTPPTASACSTLKGGKHA